MINQPHEDGKLTRAYQDLFDRGAWFITCTDGKAAKYPWNKEQRSLDRVLAHLAQGKLVGLWPQSLKKLVFDKDDGSNDTMHRLLQPYGCLAIPSETPGRAHFYVNYDGLPVGNGKWLHEGAGGELRHHGGYVVLHGDAAIMLNNWLTELERQVAPVKTVPNALIGKLIQNAGDANMRKRLPAPTTAQVSIADEAGVWPEGDRNNFLFAGLCRAIREGRPTQPLLDKGLRSGLDEAEVQDCLQSAYKTVAQSPDVFGRQSLPRPIPTITILSLADLAKLPAPSWLISEVLPDRGVAILYGDSNVGKTFVAVAMACRVAVDTGRVIYAACEDGAAIGGRVEAWTLHTGTTVPDDKFGVITTDADLRSDAYVDALIQAIQSGGASLVIVDTLRAAMPGGEENSSTDTDKLMRACRRIERELECLVLLVHHIGKDKKRGMRGSSALRAACDVAISAEEGDSGLITLTCDKMRQAGKFGKRFYQLQVSGDGLVAIPAEAPATAAIAPLGDDALGGKSTEVLRVMTASGKATLSPALIREKSDFTKSTVQRALKTLAERGFVSSPERGEYAVTDAGKAFYKGSKGSKHRVMNPMNPLNPPGQLNMGDVLGGSDITFNGLDPQGRG